MDPITCFNKLTTAFVRQEWQEAREHARDLLDWFASGRGFPGTLDHEHIRGYCIVISRICRHHIERMTPQA